MKKFKLLILVFFLSGPSISFSQEALEQPTSLEGRGGVLKAPLGGNEPDIVNLDPYTRTLKKQYLLGDNNGIANSEFNVNIDYVLPEQLLKDYETFSLGGRDGFCTAGICGPEVPDTPVITDPCIIDPKCSSFRNLIDPLRDMLLPPLYSEATSELTNDEKERIQFILLLGQSFPSTVALKYLGDEVKCSGVYLGEDIVLTAAHCVCREHPNHIYFGKNIDGSDDPKTSLNLKVAESEPILFNEGVCKGKNEVGAASIGQGDLAIIKLSRKLERLETYQYLSPRLYTASNIENEVIFVAGFGRSQASPDTGKKHFAKLSFTKYMCSESDKNLGKCVYEIVAQDPSAVKMQDSCKGDSGGPLIVFDEVDGYAKLLGITSRGYKSTRVNGQEICGNGGIYVDLQNREDGNSDVLNWLRSYSPWLFDE